MKQWHFYRWDDRDCHRPLLNFSFLPYNIEQSYIGATTVFSPNSMKIEENSNLKSFEHEINNEQFLLKDNKFMENIVNMFT